MLKIGSRHRPDGLEIELFLVYTQRSEGIGNKPPYICEYTQQTQF